MIRLSTIALAATPTADMSGPRSVAKRNAFTLLELVITMGVLAVLVGIGATGLRAALNSARDTETRTLIKLLDGVLQDRLSTYNSNVLGGRYPFYRIDGNRGKIQEFTDRFNAANSPPPGTAPDISPSVARVYVRKSLFASVFPQTFHDLCGFDGKPGLPAINDADDPASQPGISWTDVDFSSPAAYRPVDLFELGLGGRSDDPPTANVIRVAVEELEANGELSESDDPSTFRGGVDLSRHDPRTESSELMFLCLTRPILRDFPFISPDDIPAKFIGDTDNDGLPEFIDGFGQPLRFYTFTTGLFRPDPWTWDTTTARTDITAAQVQLASILARDAVRTTEIPVPGVPTAGSTTRRNLFNIDPDDPYGAVRQPNDADPTENPPGTSVTDTLLASENGFSIAVFGGGTVADAPNIPVSLGTASVPLIVSLGPDETLGLTEPASGPTASDAQAHYSRARYATPTDPGAATDNLTNVAGGL